MSKAKHKIDASKLHDFRCPLPDHLCRFQSLGWASKKLARERGRQHMAEHKDPDQTTPELREFRVEMGRESEHEPVAPENIDYDKLPSGVTASNGEES